MTGTPTGIHAPRGRALLVGQSSGLDDAARQLQQPPLHVADLFDAIGTLSDSPTNDPVTAVLVAAAEARQSGRCGVDALRRVDPAARLVLVRDADDPVDERSADGYDACLVSPVQADALCEASELRVTSLAAPAPRAPTTEPATPPPAVATPAPVVPPPTPSMTAPETRPETRPELRPGTITETGTGSEPEPDSAPAVRRPADWLDLAEPPPPRPPAIPPLDDEIPRSFTAGVAPAQGDRLGDVDLVEAVLNDRCGVGATALRLAVQETGWDDLTLGDETGGVDVRSDERSFGFLTTGHADDDELRPWAAWLGRWLALDRSFRDYRLMAYQDDLTGAWNRRFFDTFLRRSIEDAAPRRRMVTVMVFDIDDFKRYNDEFGHEAGDVILQETVRLLNSVIRKGDRVCRIGGDEFAVIFADPEGPREVGSTHPETVESLAKRFQDQVGTMHFAKLGLDAPGQLSISGGLASYPWDGGDPETLLRRADQLALHSKRMGKNVITFGPKAR